MAHRDLFYNFIGLMRLGGMKLGSKEKKKEKRNKQAAGFNAWEKSSSLYTSNDGTLVKLLVNKMRLTDHL